MIVFMGFSRFKRGIIQIVLQGQFKHQFFADSGPSTDRSGLIGFGNEDVDGGIVDGAIHIGGSFGGEFVEPCRTITDFGNALERVNQGVDVGCENDEINSIAGGSRTEVDDEALHGVVGVCCDVVIIF